MLRSACCYLDVGCEGLEEGQGVVRHGVDLWPFPVMRLAPAGGRTHFSPALVVGHVKIHLRGPTSRWASVVLVEGRPAV